MKINLAEVSTAKQLHELLAKSLEFPDSYMGNWVAFDKCLRAIVLPARLEIAGLEKLKAKLASEAQELENRINAFVREDPRKRRVTFTDN